MAQQQFNFSVDLVDAAEKVVYSLGTTKRDGKIDLLPSYSQIRKVLSIIVSTKNKLSILQTKNNEYRVLPNAIVSDIRFIKTSLLYQAGRIMSGKKYPMKQFLDTSKILVLIDSIGNNIEYFEYLCKYIEAIVAFYKYRVAELNIEANNNKTDRRY